MESPDNSLKHGTPTTQAKGIAVVVVVDDEKMRHDSVPLREDGFVRPGTFVGGTGAVTQAGARMLDTQDVSMDLESAYIETVQHSLAS
ncbi:hypothetical protein ACOMHN_047815 [Nucella lapillus]